MSTEPTVSPTSRRAFLKQTGTFAAASALAGVTLPHVHAAEDNTIRIALVGCGGRGTGAAANAMSARNGPVKLHAMADVFEDRLKGSYEGLSGDYSAKMDVPKDRQFIGFDAYKRAIDTLRKGDIVIFTTPLAFRWVHFTYAIEKEVNVFMEKPVTADGPTSRRMLDLYEKAKAKNLKVGVGLMCRHCKKRGELFDRIQNGEIGDIHTLRCYRMHGPVGSAFSEPRDAAKFPSELQWQIRRFHSFIWASGGCFNDFYIHNLDECCWMKNAWPVEVQASGGRHYRGTAVDQNFDNYSVEYTFADGAKLFLYGRTMPGVHDQFASYAHGSKSLAVISSEGHWPSKARIYKSQKMANNNLSWRCGEEGPDLDPYRVEWEDLIDAIKNDKPYNEVKRGVEASITASMGRMAAHTGQVIKWDEFLNNDHEMAPDVANFTENSPAPVLADNSGHYPIPAPGQKQRREY
jgi:predicted dehydrogenase